MPPLLPDADLLARLVAFDTTSQRSNLPLADFLADYLDRPGTRIARNLSAAGDKANLVVWLGPEPSAARAGLLLSGHMDVVPAGEGWTSDPFVLTDRGDRYVGRGACDMKGFLALAANRAAALAAGRLRAPLVLLFTYDEEVGTLGALRLVETYADGRLLPTQAIVGEPTCRRVVRLHKGHLKLRITLPGVSAHSGYPHLGENAIEPAGRVIVALTELARALAAEPAPHREMFPEVPYVPLNVGTVHGGTAINVVPERCTVEIGLRPLPGMDSAALAARVAAVCRDAAAPAVPAIEVLSDSPPLLTGDGAPIVRFLAAAVGQQETAAVSFATDAGWLARLGIECAIWGPGSISVAHKPDEHLPKAELDAARGVLDAAVERFCAEGA